MRGHRFRIVKEPKPVGADLAILHTDCTIADDEYVGLSSHFEHAVNFIKDISKRKVSKSLLARTDAWSGRVIVKSDLNYGGAVEVRRNEEAQKRGLPIPYPGAEVKPSYDIYDSIDAAPDAVWEDRGLVVEKFLPELDPEGYATRTWVFMGDKWSCMRHVSTEPIVKARGIVKSERIEPSPEIFEERKRLGMDFGKFDYVEHEGRTVLLDANRTPGIPNVPRRIRRIEGRNIADGLLGILKGR
ncbi:hypothetical protein [Hyphococcus sp.]|uniref:hypothetical protein n=1 Tax=Hyphococcus sp. TaxID=2038636 RepID=UPI0035C71EBF